MKKEKKFNTAKMVELAVLIAIIFLMAFTPIGYIKIFAVDITLIVIPVGVGAVVLGPLAGAILGGAFGVTSLILSFTSPLGALMTSINPIFRVITCLIPRILCGWGAGMVYLGVKKIKKMQKFSEVLGNLACPILNTILFTSTFIFFYFDTPEIQKMCESMGTVNPVFFAAGFVGLNGIIEAIACFVIGTAITKGLQITLKLNK